MSAVLFLCYNNGGRSQIAEACFNARAAEQNLEIRAESAGLLGVGAMHPMIVRCLEEIGLATEGLKPKQLTKEMIERATTIVSFGRVNSDHTAIKFVVSEDWSADDPSGLAYGRVCEVRDGIAKEVDDLLARLTVKS